MCWSIFGLQISLLTHRSMVENVCNIKLKSTVIPPNFLCNKNHSVHLAGRQRFGGI